MTRSRLVVFSSFLVVAVGALAALGALYLDPATASVGPLPAEGLALPAGAKFVIGLDAKRFTASPFYRRYGQQKAARPEAFGELEEKTGLNPERDVDRVVIAGGSAMGGSGAGSGARNLGIAMILGHFDAGKIGRAIESQKKNVTSKTHQGTTLYLFNEESTHPAQAVSEGAKALAVLDDHALLIGNQAAVESTLTNRAEGSAGLRSNTALIALLERVKPGSTFWMVGDQSLLANMPRTIPVPGGGTGGRGPGGGGPGGGGAADPEATQSISLPALKSLLITGDLDPLIAIEVIGEATDEAAARNLADIVRGFVAMAALQAGQRPELKGLTQAISVTTETTRVHVSARFPYELIDGLQATGHAVREKKASPPPPSSN